MNLPVEIFNDVVVVHAPEELAGEGASELEEYLPSLERKCVVLDLDGTENIDSKGLAALLGAQERLRAEGGDLKIAASNGVNRKILEITRLDQSIDVFGDCIDAVRGFR